MSEIEYFDIYTPEGSFTGKTASRSEAHKKGLWHKSIHIWIVCGEKVLLQKRSLAKESYPDKWDISAAGHISAGEDVLKTAVREIEEELGLVVAESELEFLFSVKNIAVLNDGSFIDNEINEVFLLDVSKRDISFVQKFVPNEEVSALRWFSMSEFADMVSKNDDSLVPHAEEYAELFNQCKCFLK